MSVSDSETSLRTVWGLDSEEVEELVKVAQSFCRTRAGQACQEQLDAGFALSSFWEKTRKVRFPKASQHAK